MPFPFTSTGIDDSRSPSSRAIQSLGQTGASMVQVLSADARVVEHMERSVLDELRSAAGVFALSASIHARICSSVTFSKPGMLARNFGNHVGNSVTPSGDSGQHLVRCNAAILREAIVAVDGHTNDELRLCGLPEVDASQRIFMRQIHVDVRMHRSLSSTCQFILGAMAPAAVLREAADRGSP